MEYVVDTVAIIRYISQSKNIGKKALFVFEDADNEKALIMIPIVCLMEIMYLAEKGRVKFKLKDLLERINSNSCYKIINLDSNILLAAEKITNLELHDKLIVATAKHLELPLLTCDQDIKSANIVETVWD